MSNVEVLSLYLPHGIGMKYINNAVSPNVRTLTAKNLEWYISMYSSKQSLPILKPMESITEEEVRMLESLSSHWMASEINAMIRDGMGFNCLELKPFSFIMLLIKNHYDVFGLIPKCEAVDYFTLNTTKIK